MADRERPGSGTGETLGVIDVGSNTARFVVFEVAAETVRAVYETKDVPRLGLAPGPDGRLSDAAVARGVATARRFGARACARWVSREHWPLRRARCGMHRTGRTSSARSSGPPESSCGFFQGRKRPATGYLGVAGAWELQNDLVLDLGGGSLQLAEVRSGTLRNSVSLPLGVLRLSQRFFEHDPPKRREWDELRGHVRSTLTSVLEAFGGTTYRLIGIGGTVRSLARASIEMREYPLRSCRRLLALRPRPRGTERAARRDAGGEAAGDPRASEGTGRTSSSRASSCSRSWSAR